MILVLAHTTLFSQITKCGDKVCVDVPIMDTLIHHDLMYKSFGQDIIEYKFQIASKNERIANLKANEADLKSMALTNKTLANNFKATAVDFQIKYTEAQGRSKFRGKIAIGSISVNILLLAGFFFYVRLQ